MPLILRPETAKKQGVSKDAAGNYSVGGKASAGVKAVATKAGVNPNTLALDEGSGALDINALNKIAAKREVPILSSRKGAQTIEKARKRLVELSPNEEVTMGETPQPSQATVQQTAAAAAPVSSATYLQPNTGQEIKVTDVAKNAAQVSALEKQGFQLAEGEGSIDSVFDTPELRQAKGEAAQAESELGSLLSQLNNFMVSSKDLKEQTRTIEAQWDARIQELRGISERDVQGIKTSSIRSGAQYSFGGVNAGVFGDLVSERERQLVKDVATYESEKQSAISDAKIAAKNQNWLVYSKAVDIAEKQEERKAETLKELQKEARVQNEKIQEQRRLVVRQGAITGLLEQGITNPIGILSTLNFDEKGNLVGDYTLEEITKVITDIQSVQEEEKLTGDLKEYQDALRLGIVPEGASFFDYLATKSQAEVSPYEMSLQGMNLGLKSLELQLKQQELSQGPPSTEGQKLLSTYAQRLEQANPTLNNLETKIKNMNPVSFEAQLFADKPSLQSKDIEQYTQASRNFINAVLRRESGAVISPDEFREARKQYLPVAGDSDEVLVEKKKNRDIVYESFKHSAGNAYIPLDQLLGTGSADDPLGIK